MANVNTFAALYNLTGPTSATETAVASRSSSTTRALLKVRPDLAADTSLLVMKIRAVSIGVASGACNFTQNLYWDSNNNTNLTTFTSDVLLIGSSTQALASVSGTVFQTMYLVWNRVAGQLAGFWQDSAGLANIAATPAVIKTSGAVTATNPIATGVTAVSQLNFFITHTMSANATSSTLVEYALDQV